MLTGSGTGFTGTGCIACRGARSSIPPAVPFPHPCMHYSNRSRALIYLAHAWIKTHQECVKDGKQKHWGEYARCFFNCWSSPKPESWKFPDPASLYYRDVTASSAPQLEQPRCGGPASRFRPRLASYFRLQSTTTWLRELQCKTLSYCWYVWRSTDLVEAEVFKRRQG